MPDDSIYTGPKRSGATTNNSPVDRFKVASAGMLGDVAGAVRDDLDSPKVKDLHKTLMAHYTRELEIQAPWRREMETDDRYFDGDPWEPRDKALLRERGQEPMVLNLVAQSVNWTTGTERRGRTQHKILPRRKENIRDAEKKTQLFKYLDDINMTDFHWSKAFLDATRSGLGWMEGGVQDEDEGEPIYERAESWRNIIFDSAATEFDLGDGRYQFRSKWADADIAKAIFHNRTSIIESACSHAHDYAHGLDRISDSAMDSREELVGLYGSIADDFGEADRSRLRLIEAWFKVPEMAERVSGGDFTGELYDPSSRGHVDSVESGRARISRKLTFRMYVAVMTVTGMLWLSPSPYRHNRFPFTPIWSYRNAATGAPYGMIRQMRDAQRDVNKRFSKAQHILNNNRVVMDEGAVDDLDELAEEVARPDGIIVKKQGKDLAITNDRELSAAHIQMMQLSQSMIQSLSGVTDESLGRTTNAVSGKAINARQEQGALATAPLFDNLRIARQFHGEKKLSLIEQFVDEKKEIRIVNKRGVPDYVMLNDGLPENDIARAKADFIISDEDWNATIRQANVAILLDVILKLAPVAPQLAMVMLDLVIEAMDVPNGEEIVKRVRRVTNMDDPDADPEQPDPEKQARDAAAAEQADLEKRAAEANLSLMEGKAAAEQARASKIRADVDKVMKSLPSDDLAVQSAAFDLAVKMLQGVGAVDTADALLQAAGAQQAPLPDMAAAPAMAAPMAAPAPGPAAGMQVPPNLTTP